MQGSQEQEVKFQDQIFSKCQDIFCRFHEAQDTENARFSMLTNLNQLSRSVLQSWNVTKATLHMKQWTVTIKNSSSS